MKEPKYEGFEEECRYLLWRYEEYLAAKQDVMVTEDLRADIWIQRKASETIEHIFPQNPDENGPWQGKLREGENLQNHVNRLGNLLLLPFGLNREAGNKGFKEKLLVYSRAEKLLIVKEVTTKDDWTLVEIEEREKKIAVFLREMYDDVMVTF